ncbi:MAG: threonine synthase [Holophagales bacterium]|nr:threonine synthase [Holophagales bacterium]
MKAPLSRFSCLGCGASHGIDEVLTECPACGGLLEVLHDLGSFGISGREWRDLFDRRRSALPNGETPAYERSGVWRYREHVFPALAQAEIVSKPEGSTNLYRCVELGKELGLTRLFVKHEGENPTLSFKDRGMTVGVSWAHHLGRTDVVCASTGDTSAALASYAAEVPGMRSVVLLPEAKVTGEQLSQALHQGALTLGLATDFDGCMRIVAELARTRPVYLLNSKNPVRIEGQKTIGQEAIHDLGWEVPDWFVVPVGNAGNVSAIGKGIREWLDLGVIGKRPRIAGAQAEAADPFYRSWLTGFAEHVTRTADETDASAIRIGAPVSHPRARREIELSSGLVARVTEAELLEAAALANRHGLDLSQLRRRPRGRRKAPARGVHRKGRDGRRRRDGPRDQVLGVRRSLPREPGSPRESAAEPSRHARGGRRGARRLVARYSFRVRMSISVVEPTSNSERFSSSSCEIRLSET